MNVEPLILSGRVARLEPLRADHAESLLEYATPEVFRFFTRYPTEYTLEGVRAFVQHVIDRPSACPFAIVHLELGRAIGITTYMDIRAEHRGLEIGNTWMGTPFHGSLVNPECKYMLLRHAFENLGALRVQLKTDLRNLQSQRAIEKLGAVKEGVLRRHMILQDGAIRDSVMYSITADEWAEVKRRLEARLGYAP